MIFSPKKVLPLILLWILASFSMVEAQRTTHGYSRDDGWRPEHGEAQRLAQWDRLAKDGLQKGYDEAIVVGPATVDASASEALIVGSRIAVGEDLDLAGILETATKGGGELGRGTVTVDPASDLIVWSAHLIVQGAGASSIILKGLDLPEGVELWAYTAHGFIDGPVTTTGNAGSGSHWTSPLPGESLYIELRLPADLDPSTVGSDHGTISHAGWFDPDFFGTDPLGKGPCPENADCIVSGECVDESDFTHLEDLRRAVALIVYPAGNGGFGACTGTLIATSDPDDPDSYLLTANHCFEEQDAADELRVFYDFRKTSCDAETCPGINLSNADQMGATIVHTAAQQDVTLVRLNSTPPGDRYYVGWTNEQFAEEEGMIVHRLSHPNATAQAYSRHEIRPNEVSCGGAPVGQYVYNKVVFGATDQGSSGSAIVTSDNLIIGQNRGRCGPPGSTDNPCNDAALNFDGALAAYYDDVKEFLDPDGIVEPSPTPTATPSPTPTETPTPTPTPEPTPTPTPEPTPTPTPDPTPTPTPEPTPTPTPEPTPTPTPEPTPTPTPDPTPTPTPEPTPTPTPEPTPTPGVLPELYLAPASQTVEAGGAAIVEVRLAPNSATPSGAAIWLEYDAAVLTFIGGETNTDEFDEQSLTIDPEAAGGNKVQFFAFSSSPLSGEDVLVGTLTFAANAEGSSNLEFLVEPGEETLVMDALLDEIEATLTGGSITVSPTSPTPTPTPIPVEADLFIIF